MRVRILQVVLIGSLTMGTLSAGAAAAAVPSRSTPGTAAVTPRAAVMVLIRPFLARSRQTAACNGVTGNLAACPLTSRLRAALSRELHWERTHTRGGNGNVFCRCQNTPRRMVVTGVKAPYVNAFGLFAEVDTVWYWGSGPVNISWVTRRVAGGWQIDNNFCSGDPKTDLYHIPVGPCPVM